jgi:hypothetical protein
MSVKAPRPAVWLLVASFVGLASTCVLADWQLGQACDVDFNPVPCYVKAGCDSGAHNYYCGNPEVFYSCITDENLDCFPEPNAGNCGTVYDCLGNIQIKTCKSYNSCIDRNHQG